MADRIIIDENRPRRRRYRALNTVAPSVHTHYPVEGVYTTRTYKKREAIFRSYQVVWYILGFIEVILALRVLLLLLGANPFSGFTRFIYSITNPFALPFAGIFPSSSNGVNVIEWSTLFAMLIYALLAYAIIQLLQLAKPTTPEEVDETVDNP